MSWSDPAFSGLLAAGYLGLLTILWAALVAGVGRWGRAWRLEPHQPQPARWPRLSICVPARDEAGRIGLCVRAALASDYPDLEVVVVDDRSSDATRQEALDAAGSDERFLLVDGVEPKVGWAGKPWACARAAGEATGELLLFVDADVELAPWAARATVARLLNQRLALLSLFSDWRLESFWEAVVIPVVGWFVRGAVDLDAVNDRGQPDAFANGQFILVERTAYERVGGHGAVRAEVLEDVRLARAFKSYALPSGLLHAPGAFRVRLYRGLTEIVSGYTKNLYEGMGRNAVVAFGAILFIFVGTLLPYLALAAALLVRIVLGWEVVGWGWIAWVALLCSLITGFRYRLERLDGRSGAHAFSHLLGNLVFVGILLRSLFSVEVEWKGRSFVDGKADVAE